MIQNRELDIITPRTTKLLLFVLILLISIPIFLSISVVSEGNLSAWNPPYEATTPYPPDNSTSIPPSPTLSVKIHDPPDPDGDSVTVYFFEVPDWETEIGFVSGVQNGGTISTTWHDATKPGSVHYWEVWVVDTFLLPSRSYTWRFKIDLPPDVPDNPHPFDNERYINTSPILSVDVSDPDGDNMSVTFYDASDNSKIGMVENVQSGDTASITWEDIDYGTTYNWYAVADDGIFDNRSETFSFTTNFLPVFSNLKPLDDKDDVSFYLEKLSVDISDPDGDSFDWSITTFHDIGKNQGINELNGTKICSVRDLKPDTKYTWNIEATDMRGATIKSSYHFTTKKNIAPEVNVLSPEDDSFNISIANCVLNWSCTDSDGESEKVIFDVFFGKTKNPDLVADDITDRYHNIADDLELSTTYYWKVIATDRFGKTSEENIWSFSTSPIPPPPAAGSIDIEFSKRIYFAGVKADLKNNGLRNASNVFWHVSVTGGVFGRVNISKSGCVYLLNLHETQRISTYEFLNFKTMPFGFGRSKITLTVMNIENEIVSSKSIDVLLFLRWMFVV